MTETVIEIGHKSDGVLETLQSKGVPVDACYQCLRCSAGCPMLSFMDHAPHRIIRMIQFGLDRQVLTSHTIWMCASCQTCTTRCPNDVGIAHMMDVLRQVASAQGIPCPDPEVEKFHRSFVKEIEKGRVHELSMIARYKLATRRFTDDMELGMEMFKRGRLKILPRRFSKDKNIARIIQMTREGE